MFSKYLSHWFVFFFGVWLIGYIFKINIIVEHINPYYTSILLLIGFIVLILHNIFIKKYKYESTFLFMKSIEHGLPLLISYKLIKNKHEHGLMNLMIICIIYIIFMNNINKDIYNTYLVKKPPLNWGEYFKSCKSKDGKYIPYCFLL